MQLLAINPDHISFIPRFIPSASMKCNHVFSLVVTMLCLYASAGYAKEQETIYGTIYCDNNFTFFIDGELIQQDPVDTFPHNAVNVTFSIPKDEPVVFAFTARDWSNQTTGLEYDNQLANASATEDCAQCSATEL